MRITNVLREKINRHLVVFWWRSTRGELFMEALKACSPEKPTTPLESFLSTQRQAGGTEIVARDVLSRASMSVGPASCYDANTMHDDCQC